MCQRHDRDQIRRARTCRVRKQENVYDLKENPMNKLSDDPRDFLASREFIDSDNAEIRAFTAETVGDEKDPTKAAIKLYYKIRDGIDYAPYLDFSDMGTYRASTTLKRGRGFCVGKASLLAACATAAGIPARVGFADVRNHLASQRMLDMMGTDVFFWHGYSDLYLNGKWVKATPAFDLPLCDKFGVLPLEFDGTEDSLFHEFDKSHRRYMEYVQDRGRFADTPAATIAADFEEHYPVFFEETKKGSLGSMHDEKPKT